MTISYIFEGSLYINMTNRCTNRCDFCVRTNTDALGDADSLWLEREPTVDEVIADLSARDLSQFPEIVFCGYGEPTCRLDDVIAVCDWLHAHCDVPVRINTNGLSDLEYGCDTVEKLKGHVDALSVSLNCSTAEEYDRICHSKFGLKAHPAMLDFAARAAKVIPSVTLTVVDTIPDEEIEACRKLAQQAGTKFRVRSYIGKGQ